MALTLKRCRRNLVFAIYVKEAVRCVLTTTMIPESSVDGCATAATGALAYFKIARYCFDRLLITLREANNGRNPRWNVNTWNWSRRRYTATICQCSTGEFR